MGTAARLRSPTTNDVKQEMVGGGRKGGRRTSGGEGRVEQREEASGEVNLIVS
jgi:hypothetical protein